MNNNIFIVVPDAIWFSYVPRHWRVKKIRELFSERNTKVSDKDYSALSVGKMGVVPQLDSAAKTDNGDNRKLILKGDFAINSRSDRKGSSGISEFDGSASLIITVLKPNHEINGRFSHYLLRSHYFVEEFYRNGHGLVSDLWTTKWDEMRNICIPVPPREEQDQIVHYLDWKVSQINKLIHGYQKQINLLGECKKCIISKAVLRGIKPTDFKLSENQWIGKIPSSWKCLRGKQLFQEIDNRSTLGNEELLSVSHITGITPRSQKNVTMFKSETLVGYKICDIGDIAANTMWMWQGAIGVSQFRGVISPSYNTYRQKANYYLPKYLDYLFRVPEIIQNYLVLSTGIRKSRLRLYPDKFFSIYFPVPTLFEQQEILHYIEYEISIYDKQISNIQKQIDLLREYRTRMISDVVTGQIDVRGVQIPDYVPEEDVPENEDDSEEEIEEETENDGD